MHSQVIEAPSLRSRYKLYLGTARSEWSPSHTEALTEMRNNGPMGAYINSAEGIVNLTTDVLPIEQLWIVLREPVAA